MPVKISKETWNQIKANQSKRAFKFSEDNKPFTGDPIKANKVKIEDIPIVANRVICQFVAGDPQGEPRAKATTRGKHTRMYTPKTKKTKFGYVTHPAEAWRETLRRELAGVVPAKPIRLAQVHLHLFISRPQELMRKSSPADAIPCDTKPDNDNAEKLIWDVLTEMGVLSDDCKIWNNSTIKRFAGKDSERGAGVFIHVYDDSEMVWRKEKKKKGSSRE